nr:hypothetical protein [Burkholderiales bacterium]
MKRTAWILAVLFCFAAIAVAQHQYRGSWTIEAGSGSLTAGATSDAVNSEASIDAIIVLSVTTLTLPDGDDE